MRHSVILALVFAVADASPVLIKRDSPTPESDAAAVQTFTTTAPEPEPSTLIVTSIVTATPTAPEGQQEAESTVIVTATITAPTPTGHQTLATAKPRQSSSPSNSDSDDSSLILAADQACYPRHEGDKTTTTTGSNSSSSSSSSLNLAFDFSAPCNLITAIEAQCLYGPKALEFLTLAPDSDTYPFFDSQTENDDLQPQSPSNERTCICQSQFRDAYAGCTACLAAHVPFVIRELFDSAEVMTRMMDKYCDVSYVPTKSFIEITLDDLKSGGGDGGDDEVSDEDEDEDSSSSSSSSSSTSAYPSDPIGTSTDVSLYYTMSVTRSDAYILAVPTGSDGNIDFTSTRISDGEIVPTAAEAAKQESVSGGFSSGSGSNGAAASTTSASTTSAADSSAATAYAGAAGLFAVAAFAAIGL
jgi:hypothetical protein